MNTLPMPLPPVSGALGLTWLVGASDVQQLAYAIANGRVVFTEDRDFLALAAMNEHLGIAYCDQNRRSIGQIVRGLELIWEVYEPQEMRKRIEFL